MRATRSSRCWRSRPTTCRACILSGIINYQSGSYAVAEDSLRKVVAERPRRAERAAGAGADLPAHRTCRSRRSRRWSPRCSATPDDPVLLRTPAKPTSPRATRRKPSEYFEQANALDKNNVGEPGAARAGAARGRATRSARFRISNRSRGRATRRIQADLALFSAHLRRREFDKALAASMRSRRSSRRRPLRPEPARRRSISPSAISRVRERASRRRSRFNPTFFPAAYNLGGLDMQRGQCRRRRASATSRCSPRIRRASQLLLALGGAAGRLRGRRRTTSKAGSTRRSRRIPTSSGPRLALIAFTCAAARRQGGRLRRAGALRRDSRTIRSSPRRSGATQLAGGRYQRGASSTFKQLVAAAAAESAGAACGSREAQVAVKDYSGAIDSDAPGAGAQAGSRRQAVVALAQTYARCRAARRARLREARKYAEGASRRAGRVRARGRGHVARRRSGRRRRRVSQMALATAADAGARSRAITWRWQNAGKRGRCDGDGRPNG